METMSAQTHRLNRSRVQYVEVVMCEMIWATEDGRIATKSVDSALVGIEAVPPRLVSQRKNHE